MKLRKLFKLLLVAIMLTILCIAVPNATAALSNYPMPNDGDLTEAQNIKWEIYIKTVNPSIYQQSSMMYDKVNSQVDWHQGISHLATTLFSNALSLKSILNSDISDMQLLTTTLGWYLMGVIRAEDVIPDTVPSDYKGNQKTFILEVEDDQINETFNNYFLLI